MSASEFDRERSYALTPIQEGMLFDHLHSWNSGVDIEQMVCTLEEPLDSCALREAWRSLASRHDVLRTSFRWEGLEQPIQDVYRSVPFFWEEKDWSGASESELQNLLDSYLLVDRRHGFDLRHAPLSRHTLFRFSPHKFVLVWTFHHAILDGRSFAPLLREVFSEYEAIRLGRSFRAPSRRPYVDYIDWLSRRDISASETFWRSVMRGFSAPTPLPGAVAHRRDVSPGEHREKSAVLSSEAMHLLRNFVDSNDLTLNTVVQGAWAILLGRYGDREDVVFGATRACRRGAIEGTDAMVGLFINTVPFRARLDPRAEVIPWLSDLRRRQVGVRAHEQTPLIRIREWSDVPAGNPVFETLLVFESFELETVLRSSGVEWRNRSFRLVEKTSYPLTLAANSQANLKLTLAYDRSLFSEPAIDRMLRQLLTILHSMASHPSQILSNVSFLPPSESALIASWSGGNVDFTPQPRVHTLFEAQTAATPNAPAVEWEGGELTYRQLDRRANQVARHLQSLGVGPETVVGVCLERSADLLVAILGVLKAGGAYLSQDPSIPQARATSVFDEAGVVFVITREELKYHLLRGRKAVIAIDSDREAVDRLSDERVEAGVSNENLAYVIYTSGSTGSPKGVLISHGSLASHIVAVRERFGLRETDRVLQFASISFDVAAEEIFPAWASGAAVILYPGGALSLGEFEQFLLRHKVTVANLPSSYWHEWVSRLSSGNQLPGCLRLVVVGSEPVSARRLQQWRSFAGDRVQWLNAYGLSETTITSTIYELPSETEKPPAIQGNSVPVGRPLPNTTVRLLDSELRTVPVGANGDVFIGGAGLARGYLDGGEFASGRFISDPFDATGASRLFRTGDRGFYLDDGNLVLTGRSDDQAKVRGFRVDLLEVREAIVAHPLVREAVVVVRECGPDDRRIVAYLTAREAPDDEGRQISRPEPRTHSPLHRELFREQPAKLRAGVEAETLSMRLRAFVSEKLPEYMIPSAILVLKELPRTETGKIDLRALPGLPEGREGGDRNLIAPTDPLEIRLIEIWQRIMKTRPITVLDDFFLLGGNSLLAVRLFSEIESVFAQQLPLATIFQASTVEALANVLRRGGPVSWSSLVPISSGGSKPPLYCVHAVGGNVLTYVDLARQLGPDQPVFGLQARGLDGKDVPHDRVEDMARDYVAEIRRFQPRGPYHLGGSSAGGWVAVEMAQQLLTEGQHVGLLALFDTWGPEYPKYLPGASRVAMRWNRAVQRIDLHFGNLLAAEGTAEKFRYLFGKTMRLNRRLRHVGRVYLGRLRELPVKIVHAVPRALKRVERASIEATERYVLRPYPGRIALFRATKQPRGVDFDPELGWTRIAPGRVDVYNVPGYHGSIVYEPRVRVLAEQLTMALRKANGADSPEPSGDASEIATSVSAS